jgi:hypothetical protein
MTVKQVLVGEELHQQVKAAAALMGQSIREFTEEALRAQLGPFSLPRPVKTSTGHKLLIDPRPQYETKGE